MKVYFLIIFSIVLTFVMASNGGQYVYAQDTSPVETPTLEAPQPPGEPPTEPPTEPVPIPPTLLELVLKLLEEGAGWLTGVILTLIGVAQKWSVSNVRRWFPNDKGTATKINGGIAEIFSGLTAVALALIGWGVAWLTGYVQGFDLMGLLTLAGVVFGSGWTVHKVNKVSSMARVFNLLTEVSK